MPRVSDEALNENRMWLLDQLLKDEMPTIPDHRTHDLLEVIAGFIDLRKASREVLNNAMAESDGSFHEEFRIERKYLDKLREVAGEKK